MWGVTTRKVLLTGFLVILSFSLANPATAGQNIWSSIGPEGAWVQALAIDPHTPTTLYMGTKNSGVFKSTDGGVAWNPINTGLPSYAQVSAL